MPLYTRESVSLSLSLSLREPEDPRRARRRCARAREAEGDNGSGIHRVRSALAARSSEVRVLGSSRPSTSLCKRSDWALSRSSSPTSDDDDQFLRLHAHHAPAGSVRSHLRPRAPVAHHASQAAVRLRRARQDLAPHVRAHRRQLRESSGVVVAASPVRESAACDGSGPWPPGAGAGVDGDMRALRGEALIEHTRAARCVRARQGRRASVGARFGGASSNVIKSIGQMGPRSGDLPKRHQSRQHGKSFSLSSHNSNSSSPTSARGIAKLYFSVCK